MPERIYLPGELQPAIEQLNNIINGWHYGVLTDGMAAQGVWEVREMLSKAYNKILERERVR